MALQLAILTTDYQLLLYFISGLTICGANCLLSADYKSGSKIIARTGQSRPGKGDVIVSTRSGGVGSCTVQFKSVMVVPGKQMLGETFPYSPIH